MLSIRFLSLLVVGMAVTNLFSAEDKPTSASKDLKVGDVAPNFEMIGSDGKTYKLSDYKGKSAVIVAWYPKALTGG